MPLSKSVIITRELETRPSRSPLYEAESQAMRELTRELAHSPKAILEKLVEKVVQLCQADSAAISIAETIDGDEVFRWGAATGKIKNRLDQINPSDFGSAGSALDLGSVHLLYKPIVGLEAYEVLLVPFYLNGEPLGTIWVFAEQATRKFDHEDSRLLRSIAEFTSAAVQTNSHLIELERSKGKLDQTIIDLEVERELRERFVAALTHDLRTPMTAAKITGQLLGRKEYAYTDVLRMANRIVVNMDRADSMILDLLDANRIKAGEGIPINIAECNVATSMESIARDLQEIYGPKFEFGNKAGSITAYWDFLAVQRMIENLAGNAVKYGSPGALIQITVTHEDQFAEISVHNVGNPIPPEDQKALFRLYRRTDEAVSSFQKGWGIGLALVNGIADAHGGTARVESSLELGTTFSIRLPLDARKAVCQKN
jgi:signal transduction histidine kinase